MGFLGFLVFFAVLWELPMWLLVRLARARGRSVLWAWLGAFSWPGLLAGAFLLRKSTIASGGKPISG